MTRSISTFRTLSRPLASVIRAGIAAALLLLAACAPDPTRYLMQKEADDIADIKRRHANAAHALALESFSEGEKAFAKNELGRAFTSYSRATRLMPDWDLPYVQLALLHPLYDNNHEAAVRELEYAARANPENPRTRLFLGVSYLQVNETEKALASFKEALRLKPDYAEARLRLANLYRDLKRPDEALGAYVELVAREPQNALVWSVLAALYEELKRPAKAEEALKRLVFMQRDISYAYYKLGLFYERQGRRSDAKDAFARAEALSPRGKPRAMRPLPPSRR